jgi:hypothetical protein
MTEDKQIGPVGVFFILVLPMAVIFVLSVGVVGALSVWPAVAAWRTAGWVETPCVITEAAYRDKVFSSGPTGMRHSYEANVLDRFAFQYSWDGQTYTSRRVHLAGYLYFRTPDGHKPRAGQRGHCYVNPDAPVEAVYRREFTWKYFWTGIIVGGAGMLVSGVAIRVALRGPKNKNRL